VIVGLALSYVWANLEFGDSIPSIGQPDFESGVAAKYPQPGHISKAIVLPPQEGKMKVVCEQLRRTKDPKVMKFVPVAFMADAPFKSDRTGQTYATVKEYLASTKLQNAELSFSYAWYRERWAVYVLWTGAAVMLIGVVWPSVVSLMTGGGLGLTPVKKAQAEAEYDLDRFGKGEKKEPAKAVSAASNDQAGDRAMEQLRQLDEELERRLAGGAVAGGGTPHAAAGTADSDEPVRKLDGGPLELASMSKEDELKQYGGEFYPVVKAVVKKGDEGDQGENGAGK
jgi:hypothetical protein